MGAGWKNALHTIEIIKSVSKVVQISNITKVNVHTFQDSRQRRRAAAIEVASLCAWYPTNSQNIFFIHVSDLNRSVEAKFSDTSMINRYFNAI